MPHCFHELHQRDIAVAVRVQPRRPQLADGDHLAFGGIVTSETKVPNTLVNLA